MHDPMVVAFDIKIPVPYFWSKADANQKRWSLQVWRRTNEANRGERCHAWWRPKGYRVTVAGRQLRWRTIATIWHVEPKGHDALTICRKRPHSRLPVQPEHLRRQPRRPHPLAGRTRVGPQVVPQRTQGLPHEPRQRTVVHDRHLGRQRSRSAPRSHTHPCRRDPGATHDRR